MKRFGFSPVCGRPALVLSAIAMFFCIPLFARGAGAAAQTPRTDSEYNVLDKSEYEANPVLAKMMEELDRLMASFKAPKNADELTRMQELLRPKLAKSLGLPFSAGKPPLDAVVTGRTDKDDYTIENVVYQSYPGLYVPANVYVPKNVAGRAPAVIVAIGHWYDTGKNEPIMQDLCVSLAKLGFIAITWDPIGQGERRVPGNNHNWGYNLLLTGRPIEGLMVWETMRALDYLLTRPDVDPDRIGVTGASGGGENTFYSAAVDTRLKVAAPVVFVNEFTVWGRQIGAHCICNHIPGLFQYADEFTVGSLIAPRPMLMINGTEDTIFPIEGSKITAGILTGVYGGAGATDSFRFLPVKSPHDYNKEMREAMYAWMERWLKGGKAAASIPEPAHEIYKPTDPAALAFKGDEYIKKSYTLLTLGKHFAESDGMPGADPPHGTRSEWSEELEKMRAQVIDGLGRLPGKTEMKAESRGKLEKKDFTAEKIVYYSEPDVPVPALLVSSREKKAGGAPVVIIVAREGKQATLGANIAKGLVAHGATLFLPDIRGYGETYIPYNKGVVPADNETMMVTTGIMLGEPLFGRRVWDIIRAVDYLETREDLPGGGIECYGRGEDALLCVYAGALDPRIKSVAADGLIMSYKLSFNVDPVTAEKALDFPTLQTNTEQLPKSFFIPNILSHTDVPRLLAMIAPRRVLVTDVPLKGKNKGYENLAKEVYSLLSADSAFSYLPAEKKKSAIVDWLTEGMGK